MDKKNLLNKKSFCLIGVNWVVFHPTQALIASASEDRYVKLWRYTDSKAWEDKNRQHFFAHTSNVSAVLFRPKIDRIISICGDNRMRVWAMQPGTYLPIFEHKNESRFWSLAAHPTSNLFAAGHDNGMMIFKFERERPPFCVYENFVFYVKEHQIRRLDLTTRQYYPLLILLNFLHHLEKIFR